jgi:hypothetical protein
LSLAVATAQPAAEVAQRCEIAPQIGIAGEGGADILTKYHLGCTFVARMERPAFARYASYGGV